MRFPARRGPDPRRGRRCRGDRTGTQSTTERRLVSVLFADLVDFTGFSEAHDAEVVQGVQRRYFQLAQDVVGRYGGRLEKYIGDAVMAVWGAPVGAGG